MNIPYQRLILKLSGESLTGDKSFGIDPKSCHKVAKVLKNIHDQQLELGVVIGGGNIFRGASLKAIGIAPTPSDHIGLLATLMNAIAIEETLNQLGTKAKVFTAIDCPKVAESFHWKKSIDALKSGHIVLFAGGTGNPFFTTDTAAALRASEVQANLLLKATKVNGIYSKDPLKFPDAKKYNELTYSEMLAEKLEVMDATSVALLRANRIPAFVFHMELLERLTISEILAEKQLGTLVKEG
jgi:uridylate kinase